MFSFVRTSGMSAAGVTVRLDPMARHKSATSECSQLLSKVSRENLKCTLHSRTIINGLTLRKILPKMYDGVSKRPPALWVVTGAA